MKDIAMTRYIIPSSGLSGPKPTSTVGNGIVRMQPLHRQIQQVHTPSGFVSVILAGQQITVG